MRVTSKATDIYGVKLKSHGKETIKNLKMQS